MAKQSAGILAFKVVDGSVRVLLVHPGGPFWARKDLGAWSIPKGEYEDPADPLESALRELAEETSLEVAAADCVPLGSVKQKGGKVVAAWAVAADFDPARLRSNTFEIEWPPRSGTRREFPEVDRAEWFDLATARQKLVPAQAEFVDRLVAHLSAG
ncbi:NUDIX domain-containing protein [Asanoa iriomotensis]|uniref:NTP pyrophosphohydrolase n=1 Tax=Asanoa iriomotensis TaxID=234613 RepID=A0ABQ4CB99_9ACTN|nr:NUDIX domain-containing protein [Asanoa iriomotensis]GIF59590.1 NTP pyrophosphohydrolase [Asanoa iriomotensis]